LAFARQKGCLPVSKVFCSEICHYSRRDKSNHENCYFHTAETFAEIAPPVLVSGALCAVRRRPSGGSRQSQPRDEVRAVVHSVRHGDQLPRIPRRFVSAGVAAESRMIAAGDDQTDS
jgi:hypothetical protein